jgi:hypothetical protein
MIICKIRKDLAISSFHRCELYYCVKMTEITRCDGKLQVRGFQFTQNGCGQIDWRQNDFSQKDCVQNDFRKNNWRPNDSTLNGCGRNDSTHTQVVKNGPKQQECRFKKCKNTADKMTMQSVCKQND